MFAGHLGAALAIGRIEPRVNVGLFIGASLLLDLLLWVFVLLGWESVSIPPDFALTHQPDYSFPWSHGLVTSIGWALAAGATGFAFCSGPGARRLRIAGWIAAAVFSHWILDALVHKPELPIAAAGSARVGLGLMQWMAAALVLESAILVAGVWVFFRGSPLPRARSFALATLALFVLAFTILGLTLAPPPPSPQAMAAGSLATLVLVLVLALWLGRHPTPRSPTPRHEQ